MSAHVAWCKQGSLPGTPVAVVMCAIARLAAIVAAGNNVPAPDTLLSGGRWNIHSGSNNSGNKEFLLID